MTSGAGVAGAGGPTTHGRPADPFGTLQVAEKPRPGDPYREIPIGVPDTPAEFEERKRAAELPDPPESGGDAQVDYGDDGGSKS